MTHKVQHKGKDLKGSYSDTGKTLFSTLKQTLASTSNSQSVSITPTKPISRDEKIKDSTPVPVVSVSVDVVKEESKKQP